MKLKQLFEINTGYTFRDALSTLSVGKIGVVQAGDINEGRLESIQRISIDTTRMKQHVLDTNDILISSRGRSVARTVTPDMLPAIAASSVIVLRPLGIKINPRYVAQYLNSRSGQAVLAKLMSGSYIKTLRIQELAELDIPAIKIKDQSRLILLGEVLEEQKKLLISKQELLDRVLNTAINQVNKGAN